MTKREEADVQDTEARIHSGVQGIGCKAGEGWAGSRSGSPGVGAGADLTNWSICGRRQHVIRYFDRESIRKLERDVGSALIK